MARNLSEVRKVFRIDRYPSPKFFSCGRRACLGTSRSHESSIGGTGLAFFVRESHYFAEEYIDTDDVIAFSPS